MAKKFFYVCAGLFLLLLSYHLGADRASAQSGGQVVSIASSYVGGGSYYLHAITSTGDLYESFGSNVWSYRGNIFGAPTPATPSTWGQVKDRYRR